MAFVGLSNKPTKGQDYGDERYRPGPVCAGL